MLRHNTYIETAGEGGIAKKIREAVSECKAGPVFDINNRIV